VKHIYYIVSPHCGPSIKFFESKRCGADPSGPEGIRSQPDYHRKIADTFLRGHSGKFFEQKDRIIEK